MPWEVSDEARERTTSCPFDSKCLAGNGSVGCEIKEVLEGNGAVIAGDPAGEHCPYLMSFGKSFICNCPVRCEIHTRYKK